MLWAKMRKGRASGLVSTLLATLLVSALVSPGVAVFAEEATNNPVPETIETQEPAIEIEPLIEEPVSEVPVLDSELIVEPAPEGKAAGEADLPVAEPTVMPVPEKPRPDDSVEVAPVTVVPVTISPSAVGPRDDFPEPITVGEDCDLTTIAILWAGQNYEAGTVSASNDADNLYVTFTTTGGWTMGLTHLYVGLTPPDSYAPGSFPYHTSHIPAVTSHTYTISLETLGAVPGDTIYIAAHAEVSNGQQSETAWAGTGQWPGLLFGHVVQECTEPEPDVTKTFRLTYPLAPAGMTFFAGYTMGEASSIVELLGEGPFEGQVEFPHGTEITVSWYALYGSEMVLLGTGEPEVLTEDLLNEFSYDASAAGFKFNDLDADGVWDGSESGMGGWTISLYREALDPAGFELYAVTSTAADGSYTFSGLLPGTYYVVEEDRSGWFMTVGPAGTFVISNGSAVEGLTFGNSEEPVLPFTPPDLAIEKAAGVEKADPGQLITYTLTYRNIGEGAATDFRIVDDFDERYLAIVDSGGGQVVGGTIVWDLAGPLSMADGARTLVYTARLIAEMPVGTTNVHNTVVISHPDDPNLTNNTAHDVVVVDNPALPFTPAPEEEEEEFLPFTGGESTLLGLMVLAAVLAGLGLRVASVKQ